MPISHEFVFGALSALAILTVLGARSWPANRLFVTSAIGGCFLVVNAIL